MKNTSLLSKYFNQAHLFIRWVVKVPFLGGEGSHGVKGDADPGE